MKKLFFLFAFLVGLGISSSVYAQLVKEVTLDSPNTLASKLGADVGKVTILKVSGPLGAEDFKTMKEQMNMLQVLDMSGVTELPKTAYWNESVREELQSIPREAFQNKLTLQKVIFSEALEMIDEGAFSGCNNLTEFDFSKATQLRSIGYRAFYECSGLRDLDLSACTSLVGIGSNAFYRCSNLQAVNFSGCGKLTSIGSYAFQYCSSLRTVDLSNCSALVTLESYVFSDCSNLTSVGLAGCTALTTIGEGAFNNNYSSSQLSDFDFSQLTALKDIGESAFSNSALAGDIAFASGITQLGRNAFSGCRNITSVDFSKSTQLSVISSGTFSSCQSLKKVDLSNCVSLNTLNLAAFEGCSSLEEVVINNGFYTSIDGVVFVVDKATLLLYPAGKKNEAYTIPSTVKTLGERSFPYNESLMELTIPESVLTIKGEAFYNGSFSGRGAKVIMKAEKPIGLSQSIGLENALVYVPKGFAKAYREAAFWKESKIVEIDADPVVVTLEAAGSLGAKLTELNIPLATILELRITGPMNASDFEVIKQIELLQKADLSKATMEEDRLPNYAFGGLRYLEDVILPNTIKEIGNSAFSGLSALRKVNMPEFVERIGESAFSDCSSLQKIDLSLLSHLKAVGYSTFSSSSCVPVSLKLPDGLERIDGYAFNNTGVTSVDFLNTSLSYIGNNAFCACPITGTLSFPGTLRSIGNSAFASAKVSSIKLKSTEMVRLDGADVFKSVDKTTCKVYVPKGMKDTYKANTYWSPFGNNIVEFGQLITVTTNSEYAGRVEGGGAYETGETVILKAIANTDVSFDGWYENGKKISTEPELTFKMGETDRSLEARFYGELMVFDGGDNLVNDLNKVDGPAVILYYGSLTVEGNETWKPKSFAYYRDASLLVDSDIQTEEISFNWDAWSGYWHFVSFPYDLKMSEIKLTSSDARFVVREYDGKARADKGVGESWRQLSDSETLKANKGYIIQFNSGDTMADGFTTNTGDMKALLNRASVTIPLNTYASDNAMNANWNFVGNPYPAYYSVERLFAEGLDATVTVWSPDLNNYEYYTQDDKDVYLTPLTAFFVQKKTSNLVFNPEGRVAALPRETQAASALRSVDNRQVVNLLLAGEKASDRTRVVFNEEASMEYEIGLDAAKFSSPNKDAASFYSLDKDGNRLAINERPVADGVVRLGCVLPAKGSYTISLKEKSGKGIQLVDKQTGAVCDLNQEAYTFEAEAGTLSDRFELRSDVVTSVEAIDASIRWNVREGLLIVSGLRDVETLNVCDAVGRTHFAGKVTDGEVHIALPQSGIYYMTWTTKAGERQTCSIKW
ncbi:leucine-rich repeat protein [Parabacteroides distasonis]|uniref:Leucine-rich repeat domain-containing protein n=1 Tax=Parabacteroides distasonis TaxID=823 RepID=A0A5C6KD49_PARDI|nr:leucine-rich repeat protein [Parabacteroides distasonis]TWV59578.1 leucine-rich repeat domain-containing protein [Parabacteroides distasonis]